MPGSSSAIASIPSSVKESLIPAVTHDTLLSITAITTGAEHSCAVTSGGAARCRGENRSGQIGNDSTFDVGLPTDVVGLSSGVFRIAARGGHTCALTSSGSVKCWGENGSSLLGDGTATWRLTPVDVIGITGATAIAVEPFVFKTGFEFDE